MTHLTVDPKPPRRFRLFLRITAAIAIFFVLVIAALPTLLSTGFARKQLVRVVNKSLSPGRIELGGASFSWIRPVVLDDLALIDPTGKAVVTAQSVKTERGIFGLLVAKPNFGMIRVDGATVDVERKADGSIDVLDALGGLMAEGEDSGEKSTTEVTVVVKGGKVRIASPELAEAIVSESFEGTAAIVPGKPVDVKLIIGDATRSLELLAGYDMDAPSGAPADQSVTLTGKDWPLALREAGLTTRGRLVGTLRADRKAGFWSARGDAELRGVVADGPMLAGDRLTFESVTANCDLAQSKAGWAIAKLDVKCPVAEISATGNIPAVGGTPGRLTGFVDLAALSKMLPLTVKLRDGIAIDRGRVEVSANLTTVDGADRLNVSAGVAELAATDRGKPLVLRNPVSLTAGLVRNKGLMSVESFAIKGTGLDASASGDLARGVKLSARVDLAAIQAQVRDLVELGAIEAVGKGRIVADYRPEKGSYNARFAAEFEGLKVAGLSAEPIVRDHSRVEGTAEGPSGVDGLPKGWATARVGVVSGETKANLHAKLAGGVTSVVLDGSLPIASPVAAVAQGKVAMHWLGQVYDIDELQLVATPTGPKATGAIALAAKGRLDLAAGELVLTPIGSPSASGISLAAQGLKVSGIGKDTMVVDAALAGDLAALDRTVAVWTQSPLQGLGGGWSGRVTLDRHEGALGFNGQVTLANLSAPSSIGPVALAVKGTYNTPTDGLDLASLELATAMGRLVVGGKVAGVTTKRLADLSGTFDPHWETLDPIVASSVEPKARVRATFKPFHVAGPLSGGSVSQILKGIEGEVGLDIASAEAFGMKLGATPVVLRMAGGKAAFDPIETTLNEGKVAINGDLYLDDPNSLWLRLGKGSAITEASINEAVSDSLLSYIAPVLSKASNVSGKVSLSIDQAAIPLMGDGSLRVDGQLVFQGVVFQPGPFATEVFSLTGKATPKMTLHQPLQLQIADGRVKQSGLSIPLAANAKANLEGSVGFDQTLAIRAQLPVTPQMIGNDARLGQIVGDTNITLPIAGTISKPAIDRAGFRLAVKDAAKSMVKRGVKAEAGRLLDQALPSNARPGANGKPGSGGRMKLLEDVGRELLQPK